MQKPLIGLLDCNNFFVSCERLFRPDLINKPVVVLSSNDGNVVARSQEVKDMNVPMGVPYFQIKDILEKGGVTTFSSHIALYRDISRRVFEVMREELEVVEQYSVDEAFFKVEGSPEETASRVRKAVQQQVGIPVSVGLAPTKTMAKQANHIAKKGSGVCVLDDQLWESLVDKTKLSEIWGVGGGLEMKYKQHGLVSVADLLRTDTAVLSNLFGLPGLRLQKELNSISVFKIGDKHQAQKSIMSSRSFKTETEDINVLADSLAYHARHTAADLRKIKMKTNAIRVALKTNRFGDFFMRGGSKEAVLVAPTNDSIKLLKIASGLLNDLYEKDVPYKKVGVTLSQFTPEGVDQVNIYEESNNDGSDMLMKTLDAVNNIKGREVVQLGSRLLSKQWRSRNESCSPSYTTRWDDLVSVKAK